MRHFPSIPILLAAASLAVATAAPAQRLARKPELLNGVEITSESRARFPAGLPDSISYGSAMLSLHVLANGSVDSVTVERTTNPAFAGPARAVGMRMRFAPGRRADGSTVSAWTQMPVYFPAPARIGAEAHPDGVQNGSAPPDEGTYELSAVEEAPRILNATQVERIIAGSYPKALRDSAVAGEVAVRFRILEDGTVDPETITVEQTTHPAFAAPAVAATRRMRFSPARVAGRAVKVWVTVPISFGFVGDPAPPPAGTSGSSGPPPARP